jgi:hypothetical protein
MPASSELIRDARRAVLPRGLRARRHPAGFRRVSGTSPATANGTPRASVDFRSRSPTSVGPGHSDSKDLHCVYIGLTTAW